MNGGTRQQMKRKLAGYESTQQKPRMRISSPGTQNFPRNSLFQLFQKKIPLFPLIRGEKGVILGRDKKNIIPG